MTGKEFAEAFRKALVEVLVPEIKVMQGQLDRLEKRAEEHGHILQEHGRILQEHDRKLEMLVVAVNGLKEGFNELKEGQQRILDRLDVDKRMTRLEMLVDEMRRNAGRSLSAP